MTRRVASLLIALIISGCQAIDMPDFNLEGLVVTVTPVTTLVNEPNSPSLTIPPTFTITPTDIIPTQTQVPDCQIEEVEIVCVATVCNIRTEPTPNGGNVAFSVPNNTILATSHSCSFEGNPIPKWYIVGYEDASYFYAAGVNTVWAEVGEDDG